MAAAPAMSLKNFLHQVGEKLPDEIGRGHHTSQYQHSTAFSFHLLKLCHEENLALVVSMPSSPHSKLIVLSASNAGTSNHNIHESCHGEQPPDEVSRDHHTSQCQHATSFFPLLKLGHEENLALVGLTPCSTDSKFRSSTVRPFYVVIWYAISLPPSAVRQSFMLKPSKLCRLDASTS
jgi:hypothetical protein